MYHLSSIYAARGMGACMAWHGRHARVTDTAGGGLCWARHDEGRLQLHTLIYVLLQNKIECGVRVPALRT